MKKIFIIGLALALSACGGTNEKEKKGFEYSRTKKEEKKATQLQESAPVDLNNVGIGPITDLVFDDSIDTEMAEVGKTAFQQKCTACHKTNAKLIGPKMEGIFEKRHPAWVMNMILNPTKMVKEDPIAMALLKEYNNTLMINQNLSQEEARAIVEYLRTL